MTPIGPPRIAQWLLANTLPDDVRGASVRGDLFEEFNERASRTAPRAARRWYWTQALAIVGRTIVGRAPGAGISDRVRRKASLMDALMIDLKCAVRALLRARAFAAMAIVTLALGIGASTAVFSVVDAVLVRPLSFAHPEQVMWMTEVADTGSPMSVSWPDYLDWRARQTAFADIAAVRTDNINLTGSGEPTRLTGRWVTWNFLSLLGVQPVLGRTFTEREDRPGAARVVLISDGFWRRQFNADPAVVGRVIMLDGAAHEVIGVLPAWFRYNPLTNDQVFVSMGQRATPEGGLPDRGNHNGLSVIGRLRSGVDPRKARDELKTIAAGLTQAYPKTNANVVTQLMPVTERLVGDVAPTLEILFGAVAFLLLIGAVNVANLLVARSISRQHELAVRAALGCGRWRLVRQLVVESAVLALVGGACGLVVSVVLIKILIATAPPDMPRLDEVRMDGVVWAFALAASTLSALVLSAFPGVQSSGVRGQLVLVRAGRGDTVTASAHRIRRGLMVVEVALALVLLTGAGLMVRTVRALAVVSPGFDPTNVLTLRFNVDGEADAGFDRRLNLLYDQVLTRLGAVPGVERAAFTLSLPIEGSQWGSIFILNDRPVPARALLPSAAFIPVTAGYFETMKMTLRAGRFFDASDAAGAPATIVVNEAFARALWPGGNALGRAIGQGLKQGWPEDPTSWRTIVGVVGDVKLEGVDQPTPLQVYLPMHQHPASSVSLVVRAAIAPASLIKPVAMVIHDVDPNVPVYRVQSMEDLMASAVARQRLTMIILGGFATIALVLAFVGLYGVISHGVSERTREIGVRLALGSTRGQVIRLFVGQGIVTTAVGLAIGGALALALSRAAERLLFNVRPTDPAAMWAAIGLLSGVALSACYLPARRASRVSPTVALRGE
jgi:putative ABC transport system permease protein